MKNKWLPILTTWIVLAALSLACSLGGGKATEEPAAPPAPAAGQEDKQPAEPPLATGKGEHGAGDGGSNAQFPMPEAKIEGLTDLGNGQINYQVNMDLDAVIAFYKQAFKAQGLVEREIVFSQTDTTFSMVFDGDPSGNAIVVQGVVIQDKVNVNIRYEDL
ncbi:MAG: hypothetical protein HPY59_08665 [Anaerolineae bacterium]|nr:hypothetical protein [Anaerolineae bacterium]